MQQGGHDVLCVTNGLEALEHIANHPSSFDVLVVDIFMPVLDGIETIKRLRAEECPMKMKIIAYSANEEGSNAVEEALAAGADSFLPKPFTVKQFEDCMLQLNFS
jgi:CheY-like chemotaxis protein